MDKVKVLAIGELLWDELPSGAVLGGAPANFSYRMANFGIECYLISRVGNDKRGIEARRLITEKGINATLLQVDPELETGRVTVSLDEGGNATYVIHTNVAFDRIEASKDLLSRAHDADVICFGTLIQRSEISRNTIRELLKNAPEAIKILDINLRKECYSKDTIESSMVLADIVKLNNEELHVLRELLDLRGADDIALGRELLARYQLHSCLITRGSAGVLGVGRDDVVADIAGNAVNVQDTVGSGDAFTAGFIAGVLEDRTFPECCKLGNLLGAKVAETRGGMSPVMLDGELAALVR